MAHPCPSLACCALASCAQPPSPPVPLLPQVEHHAEVLPAVLAVMANEPDPDQQERACYAVDTFCEALEPAEIAPYMAQVRHTWHR